MSKQCKIIAKPSQMTHDQWLSIRQNSIGGSEISAAAGLNRFKTQFELFVEKTGPVKHIQETEPMHWGNILEPVIREEFSRRTGWEVEKPDYVLASTATPFMTANLDGLIHFDDDSYGVLEIKTANAFAASDWSDGGCPVEYYMQIQYYLYVTGLTKGYLAALIGGNDYRMIPVERDEATISKMVELATYFWNNYVRKHQAPPVDAGDISPLNELYPSAKPQSSMILDSKFSTIISDYLQAKADMDEAKKRKDIAEAQIKEAMADNESAVLDGLYKISWKNSTRTSFSADKAKAFLTEEQITSCTATSTSRTFRVTKAKTKK